MMDMVVLSMVMGSITSLFLGNILYDEHTFISFLFTVFGAVIWFMIGSIVFGSLLAGYVLLLIALGVIWVMLDGF